MAIAPATNDSGSEPLPPVVGEPSPSDPPQPRAQGFTSGWVAAIATVTIARALAIAFLPVLLIEAPVVLLMMSPASGDLILAVPLLSSWVYFVVAMAASMLQTAVAYHFGRALGGRALIWLEGKGMASHRVATRVLGWLERGAPVVLVTLPGLMVCALAGVARVEWRVFYPLIFVGNLVWVAGCFVFGAALTEQLDVLHGFIAQHLLLLSLLAAGWVVLQSLWSRWRRRRAAGLAE